MRAIISSDLATGNGSRNQKRLALQTQQTFCQITTSEIYSLFSIDKIARVSVVISLLFDIYIPPKSYKVLNHVILFYESFLRNRPCLTKNKQIVWNNFIKILQPETEVGTNSGSRLKLSKFSVKSQMVKFSLSSNR